MGIPRTEFATQWWFKKKVVRFSPYPPFFQKKVVKIEPPYPFSKKKVDIFEPPYPFPKKKQSFLNHPPLKLIIVMCFTTFFLSLHKYCLLSVKFY